MEELTAELAELALELIEEYGAEVSYQPKQSSEYDPETSSAAELAGQATIVKALIEDYDLQGSGQGFASGLIKAGDKKFTIAGSALSEIEPGAQITFADTAYEAVNIKQTYVGATPVLYQVQGRS